MDDVERKRLAEPTATKDETPKEPRPRKVFEDLKRRLPGVLSFQAEYAARPVEDPKRIAAHFLCLLYQVRTEKVDRELPHKIVRGEAQVAPWRIRDSNDNAATELRILKDAAARLDIPSSLLSDEMSAAARLSFEAQKEALQQLPEAVKKAHAWAIARHGQPSVVMSKDDPLPNWDDLIFEGKPSAGKIHIGKDDAREVTLGRFKAEANIEFLEASSDSFKDFIDALEFSHKAITAALLGKPTPAYREKDGVLWRSFGAAPGRFCVGNMIFEGGTWWERLGTTFGDPKDNRLRKFVQRSGQLVEVRTRGRTGFRSLKEAVDAALKKPITGRSIGQIIIDDAVTKDTL